MAYVDINVYISLKRIIKIIIITKTLPTVSDHEQSTKQEEANKYIGKMNYQKLNDPLCKTV